MGRWRLARDAIVRMSGVVFDALVSGDLVEVELIRQEPFDDEDPDEDPWFDLQFTLEGGQHLDDGISKIAIHNLNTEILKGLKQRINEALCGNKIVELRGRKK